MSRYTQERIALRAECNKLQARIEQLEHSQTAAVAKITGKLLEKIDREVEEKLWRERMKGDYDELWNEKAFQLRQALASAEAAAKEKEQVESPLP